MVEREPQAPQELVAARENYKTAFVNVLESRGLTAGAPLRILQVNCIPVLEAECNEDDGRIDLPRALETAFFAPYKGIQAPEGDPEPVSVRSASLSFDKGIIEIAPKIIDYTSEPKVEGFVTIITFDLDKGKYDIEVDRIDDKEGQAGEISHVMPGIIETHELTPNMVDDLTSFVASLDSRQMSRISIYKNPPTE